jgi:hypothetical protein
MAAAREHGVAGGRSPLSVASGAIYFGCLLLGVPKTVKDISKGVGVNEGTIRAIYRLYYADREKLVKDEWIKEGKVDMDRLPVERVKTREYPSLCLAIPPSASRSPPSTLPSCRSAIRAHHEDRIFISI